MLCKLSSDGNYSYECENTSVFDFKKYSEKGFSIALGCFDGVHAGHRALLDEAKKGGLTPAVWSFSAPLSVPYIDEVSDRLKLCGTLGIKYAFCEDFDDVRKLTPEKFVDRLSFLGAKKLVCGEDFRFGYQRSGDIGLLSSYGKKLGIEVVIVPAVYKDVGGVKLKVSSTSVRHFITEGKMEEANLLLSRPFTVSGCVSKGKQLGQTIGFPTVNLYLLPDRIEPRHGVYVTNCKIGNEKYPAVTNVGVRPTVDRMGGNVSFETYIIGKNADLYGKYIEIEFLSFIRPEIAFDSLDDLKKQIRADIKTARQAPWQVSTCRQIDSRQGTRLAWGSTPGSE